MSGPPRNSASFRLEEPLLIVRICLTSVVMAYLNFLLCLNRLPRRTVTKFDPHFLIQVYRRDVKSRKVVGGMDICLIDYSYSLKLLATAIQSHPQVEQHWTDGIQC